METEGGQIRLLPSSLRQSTAVRDVLAWAVVAFRLVVRCQEHMGHEARVDDLFP